MQGQFIIHERVAGDTGRITKLALDFTSPQGSGPVQASGALRINSTVPVPP